MYLNKVFIYQLRVEQNIGAKAQTYSWKLLGDPISFDANKNLGSTIHVIDKTMKEGNIRVIFDIYQSPIKGDYHYTNEKSTESRLKSVLFFQLIEDTVYPTWDEVSQDILFDQHDEFELITSNDGHIFGILNAKFSGVSLERDRGSTEGYEYQRG